jgi:serine/threonine protein kinase
MGGSNNMDTERICPSCQKPLAPDVPMGLCPECLIKSGFPTGTESGAVKRPPFIPPTVEELARHFPQLEILEFIGQGGMGAVYKTRQKQLDRIVALKILPPQVAHGPGFAERFTREARALARLNHPHIVTLYEFGQTDGLFYFLMEFVDGINLRQLLNASRIAPKEALAIVPQICEALQFAHDEGIVHRDIKPENLLLDKKGRVKIADFGVAKIVGQGLDETAAGKSSGESGELTEAGSVLGTPQYMAPEQVAHPLEVDHRADIYSLGVVFYQMLTGELPTGKFEPPSRKVHIDVRLDEVVLRALEKKPELRYQQASVLKTQVETIAQTPASKMSEPAVQPSPSSQDENERVRGQVKAPAIGLLVAGVLNLVALVVCAVAEFVEERIHPTIHFGPPGPHTMHTILPGPGPEVYTLLGMQALMLSIPTVFILLGASRMRRLETYGLAVTASILAIIVPPGLLVLIPLFLLRVPFGIWALVVLLRSDVRNAFAAGRKQGGVIAQTNKSAIVPRFSRTAMVGAAWLPFFFGALVQANLVDSRLREYNFVAIVLIFLSLAGCFGTTILGWIAVTQIRRSKERIYGMWLAVFDGLFFPLVLLGIGMAAEIKGAVYDSVSDDYKTLIGSICVPAVLVLWLVAVYFIVRRVWRAVNKSPDGSPVLKANLPPSQPRKSAQNKLLPNLPLFVASMSGVLGAVAFCLFPNPPIILVWSILVVALLAIALGIPARGNWFGKSAIIVGSINATIWLAVGIAVQFINLPQPAGAQIHYAVFQMDAPLVDRLIPVAVRENGVMRGIKPNLAESQVTAASTNGVFTWTGSQRAEISPETQTRLRNEMTANGAGNGGGLFESSTAVDHWPIGGTIGGGYANGNDGNEAGGGTGFLGVERTDRGLLIRIECDLDHRANDLRNNLVQSKILYEGPLPQTNALAFLVPFEKKDGSAHYLVALFEISAPPPIGLVMERELPFEQSTVGPHYINFRTGKILSPSPDLQVTRGKNDFENWASQNGADALADNLASGPKLASYEMGCKFIAVGVEQWNKISTSELDKEFAGTNVDEAAATPDPKAIPATFLFKTREGTAGVLQILGETDNPRSVRFRYKLLQATESSAEGN